MTKLQETARKAGLAYQFEKTEIEADHTIYEKGYLHGYHEAEKDSLNEHADYWYWRLREIVKVLKDGQDISFTGEIVKFRNKFKQ